VARFVSIAFATLLAGGLHAWAGTFRVTPVIVELSARRPHCSVSVANLSLIPERIQIQILRWTARDADDEYSETNDILVNPPIFTVAAGGTQILRLGLRHPKPSTQEISYRLVLQELPPAKKTAGNVLGTVLRVSLPVFVTSSGGGAPDLKWEYRCSELGKATVRVENRGNAHERMEKLMFLLGDASEAFEVKDSLTYVLPGGRREFALRNPALGSKSRLVVKARAIRGNIEVVVPPSQF